MYLIQDMIDYNITRDIDTPAMAALSAVIDIENYASVLTMPKFVVDATGDVFFLPDDDQHWWGSLPGETYRLFAQNAGHSLEEKIGEVITSVVAFYHSVLDNQARPVLDWTIDPADGTIRLNATFASEPTFVTLRHATTITKGTRDFRILRQTQDWSPCETVESGGACFQPVLWFHKPLKPTAVTVAKSGLITHQYTANMPLPDDGFWRGFFIEVKYKGGKGTYYRLSTQVSIIPDTMAFPPCVGEECTGAIV